MPAVVHKEALCIKAEGAAARPLLSARCLEDEEAVTLDRHVERISGGAVRAGPTVSQRIGSGKCLTYQSRKDAFGLEAVRVRVGEIVRYNFLATFPVAKCAGGAGNSVGHDRRG